MTEAEARRVLAQARLVGALTACERCGGPLWSRHGHGTQHEPPRVKLKLISAKRCLTCHIVWVVDREEYTDAVALLGEPAS